MRFGAGYPILQKVGSSLPKDLGKLLSPGARFMAAPGRVLSCKHSTPSHKSQAGGWLNGEALFLERGVAGHSWQSTALQEPCPCPPGDQDGAWGVSLCSVDVLLPGQRRLFLWGSPLLLGLPHSCSRGPASAQSIVQPGRESALPCTQSVSNHGSECRSWDVLLRTVLSPAHSNACP